MIPFNKPHVVGTEFEYIQQAVDNLHVSGNGLFTRKCEALLEQELRVPRAFLTTSCTHALEMAAMLLDIKPGDEIIVPSFTFVSTVNAFVLRGARPVFIDVRPDTLNLDESQVPQLITPRTKAIVVVHYAGIGCEMDAILAVARRHDLPVIEDNAHGLYGRYRDRSLGTLGCLAALSFHETKNFTCGEGGALLVNDPRFIERAEIIRDKGTDRSRLFRGEVDKYTWVDIGSSYLLSEILAAFLYAQLEGRESIQTRRGRIWEYYYAQLKEWASNNRVQLPFVPAHCEQPYHMFHLVLASPEARAALIRHLSSLGVNAISHYQPLHLSSMGRRFGGKEGDCPVAETVSDRLLRLPFYSDMNEMDQARVVDALKSCARIN